MKRDWGRIERSLTSALREGREQRFGDWARAVRSRTGTGMDTRSYFPTSKPNTNERFPLPAEAAEPLLPAGFGGESKDGIIIIDGFAYLLRHCVVARAAGLCQCRVVRDSTAPRGPAGVGNRDPTPAVIFRPSDGPRIGWSGSKMWRRWAQRSQSPAKRISGIPSPEKNRA